MTAASRRSLEILSKLIAAKSVVGTTNQPMIRALQALLPKRGASVTVRRVRAAKYPAWNMQVDVPGRRSGRRLMLSGHTDTVPASQGWKTDPWTLTKGGDRLYGLGTSDMKSSIAAAIAALEQVRFQPERPVTLLLDADEESQALGGRQFQKDLHFKNVDIIVGEATDGNVRIGQKANLWFEITVRGQSHHASRATRQVNRTDNAIHKASRIIQALEKREPGLARRGSSLTGPSTQAVTLMRGGHAGNSVPDTCVFVVDRRLVPGETIPEEIRVMKSLVAVVDRTAQVKITFRGDGYTLTKQDAWARQVLQAVRRTGASPKMIFGQGWTEAALFHRWGPTVIYGPGTTTAIHQANESLSWRTYEGAVAVWRQLMTA